MESHSVSDGDIGLDRSPINHHGQIHLANQASPSPNPVAQSSLSHRTIRHSFDERRHLAAIKLREAFHISKSSDEQINSTPSLLASNTAEPSESRLDHDLPVPDKATVKELFHNPIDTIKDRISAQGSHQAAANIAAKEISHGQEVDLVRAHDRVALTKTDSEKISAEQDLSRLIKERQDMRSLSTFESKTIQGDMVTDWNAYRTHQIQYYAHKYGGQYIGYGSSPPAPSKESIMPNIERVIIASAPLQEFVMRTRRVYRWEDPAETLKYLAIYSVLWYFDLLLPGMISVIMYLVLRRHFYGYTLDDVRKEIKRTEDVHQTALTLTEFIRKEGDELWTEKILQDLGPWLMIQLCDAANMFEVMQNFYEWRVPSRTMATLLIFLFAILFTTFAPTWLLVKSTTFSIGITFFGLFPLASNFPDYRLLASIPKRIFWNIPTHAEWAFQVLQAEGSRYLSSTQPEVEHRDNVDYGFYTGHYNGDRGRLIISAFSIRFEKTLGHRAMWDINYDQITNLEKVDRIASKTLSKGGSGKDLRVVTKHAEEHEYLLVDLDDRDQAFSQIVGFSNTNWQIVW
ncbi:hypothetical protein M8818_004004 [Zalaria obscura]|uniref:Uncharacterized protein n=1 Tax=Zalaria obscura TaxID=2024903 RepID=A0ACC3SGB9_9PEZI